MNYQRTKGPKPPLLQAKPGAPKSEENLKIHCYRAIQYYLARKSFAEVASDTILRQGIEKSVKSFIARLPSPQLVAKRFQSLVELLFETSRTVSAPTLSVSAMNG